MKQMLSKNRTQYKSTTFKSQKKPIITTIRKHKNNNKCLLKTSRKQTEMEK